MIFVVLVMALLLTGCTGTKQPPIVEKKDFERDYVVYQQGTALMVQFLDDKSTLTLTEKFIADIGYDSNIVNSKDHFLISADHSRIAYPEYADGYATFYVMDLNDLDSEPIVIDTYIDVDGVNNPKIRANADLDEFIYLRALNGNYNAIRLVYNDLNKKTEMSSEVIGAELYTNADLSRALVTGSDRYLHVIDREGNDLQLTSTVKADVLMEVSADLNTVIFTTYDQGTYYVQSGNEVRFPDNHLMQMRNTGAYIDEEGRVISISYEDSAYALSDVIKKNTNNYRIEERMASGEKVKLMQVNIISEDKATISVPVSSFLLEPQYSEVYNSTVFVARDIDQQKLSTLKVNMSDLTISWYDNQIYGLSDQYRSDSVFLYLVDQDLKKIPVEGYDALDNEYIGYSYWLEDGKTFVSLAHNNAVNFNSVLNRYTLDSNANSLVPTMIANYVCSYDLGSFTGALPATKGTVLYYKDASNNCGNNGKRLYFLDGKPIPEVEKDHYINNAITIGSTIVYQMGEFGEFGTPLMAFDGTTNHQLTDNVQSMIADGTRQMIYTVNISSDPYVNNLEAWLYDGSSTSRLLESVNRVFFIYNAKDE